MRLRNINFKPIILILLIAGIIGAGYHFVSENSKYYVMYFPETEFQLDESQVKAEYGTIGVVKIAETFHTGNGYMAVVFKRVIKGPVDTTADITIYSTNPEKPHSEKYSYNIYVDKLGIVHNKDLQNYSATEYILACLAGLFGLFGLVFFYMYAQRARRNSCSDRTMTNLTTSILLLIMGISFAIFSYNAHYYPMYSSTLPTGYVLLQELHKCVLALCLLAGLMSLSVLASKEKFGALSLLASIGIAAIMLMVDFGESTKEILINSGITSISAFLLAHFISSYVCTVLAGRHKPAHDKAYIILFSETKDDEIEACVDKAIDFYIEQVKDDQESQFIASGQKAETIKALLMEKGASDTQIIVENKSKSLKSSFVKTHKLISLNFAGAYATFVTPNYEVYKTGNVASNLMLSIEGMGASTPNGKIASLVIKNWLSVIKTSPVMEIIMLAMTIALPILTTRI